MCGGDWFVLTEYASRLYLLGLSHFGRAYYSSLLMEYVWSDVHYLQARVLRAVEEEKPLQGEV